MGLDKETQKYFRDALEDNPMASFTEETPRGFLETLQSNRHV